jgi:hypothetical protein
MGKILSNVYEDNLLQEELEIAKQNYPPGLPSVRIWTTICLDSQKDNWFPKTSCAGLPDNLRERERERKPRITWTDEEAGITVEVAEAKDVEG